MSSSIIRWRNGLMALSVMAISSCLTRGYEPRDLETGRAILLIPTSNPTRARSRRDVYRASGLVHGGIAGLRDARWPRAFLQRRNLGGERPRELVERTLCPVLLRDVMHVFRAMIS